MATADTSNKKIGALDTASTPLAAANELVINQNGDIVKTPLSEIEAKVFDSKTAITTPAGTEVAVVRQTDNTLRQVALADIVPALNITTGKIADGAVTDVKIGTISTAGKVTNSAVQAVSTNTANRIVTRDGSGNFEAGIITATLAGNATTASSVADGSITTAKIVDGNVTLAKLVAAVQQALVPAGAVQAFAMNIAPDGWLAANGSNVSRSTYAALFSAIGTTYGAGDGSTTFSLPDLRGYFVRGSGTNSDGSASGTFGAKQGGSIFNHTHSGTTGGESADHVHGFSGTFSGSGTTTSQVVMAGGAGANISVGGGGYGPVGFTGVSVSTSISGNTGGRSAAHTHSFTTGNPSVGGASETRPANIAMLYCIKF
jgi:microcystin-dependent protein